MGNASLIKAVSSSSPHKASALQTQQEDARGSAMTLARALTLLKAFHGDPNPLAHAELMRRTGFSRASVSRLIATLVALGYLCRAPDGVRYQIGVRSLRLGHRYLEASLIRRLAQPLMQSFADLHSIAVALAVRDGTRMLYLEHCKARGIQTLRLGVGSMVPIENTAVGRAYLWAVDSEQRANVLTEINSRHGKQPPDLPNRIQAAFDGIASDGYCIAIGEYRPDTFGLATPVFLGNPGTLLCLNFSGVSVAPSERHMRRVLAPDLLRLADRLRSTFLSVESMSL